MNLPLPLFFDVERKTIPAADQPTNQLADREPDLLFMALSPAQFSESLLRWYDAQGIKLPWRGVDNPYFVWLSEIMLQQTQVAAVIPYFARFTARFPTLRALAEAPLDDVLKHWEGLGYYSRARNLQRATQKMTAAHQDELPRTAAELLELPGIGPYTAGAIASIAFGERVAAVDGNVIRILTRLLDLSDDVTQPSVQERLWREAEMILPDARVGDFNQALMDLGRTICKPGVPLCERCPVRVHCAAYANGTQAARPVKAKKPPTPHYEVAAGVIYNTDGQLLIAQRLANGLLGGLWEFPGGKQEHGETLPECLARELREELAIEVRIGALITKVKHGFTHFKITLHAFSCQYVSIGDPQALGCQGWRWVTLAECDQFAFGKADLQVIRALREQANRLF